MISSCKVDAQTGPISRLAAGNDIENLKRRKDELQENWCILPQATASANAIASHVQLALRNAKLKTETTYLGKCISVSLFLTGSGQPLCYTNCLSGKRPHLSNDTLPFWHFLAAYSVHNPLVPCPSEILGSKTIRADLRSLDPCIHHANCSDRWRRKHLSLKWFSMV